MRLREYKPRKSTSQCKKAVDMKRWYLANRDRVCTERRRKYALDTNWITRAAKRKEASRRYNYNLKVSYRQLVDKLKDNPCLDCGNRFSSECMDFDHVRGAKLFSIGQMGHRRHESILEEIAKCDLVCSNCHRIRTNNRRKMVVV
jgi:hypothetical protein